jgi:hypothetical protein
MQKVCSACDVARCESCFHGISYTSLQSRSARGWLESASRPLPQKITNDRLTDLLNDGNNRVAECRRRMRVKSTFSMMVCITSHDGSEIVEGDDA